MVDPEPGTAPRTVCAIADVHGRADLLGALLDAIERGLPDARVVMLGDVIDRGPDVVGALRLVREVPARFPGSEVLLGNHENWLLAAIDGDMDAWEQWRTWGGRATLEAHGIDADAPPWAMRDAFMARDPGLIPFLRTRPRKLPGTGAAADCLFVHAGVDPLVPLDEQDEDDLIWIREPFLSWPHPLERVIVHGHTIVDRPEIGPHRIGLDTGAYRSGVLSCLVMEPDGTRRFIAARGDIGGRPVVGPIRAARPARPFRSSVW